MNATSERPPKAERDKTIPGTLYKYLCPERFDVLTKTRIRFTQPNELNDPFEFNPGMPSDPGHFERKIANLRREDFEKRRNDYGVLSLSERCDSIPMWTHYAQAHQGFAIGFDRDSEWLRYAIESNKLRPVDYRNERVSYTRGTENEHWASPEIIFRTKSTEWAYECEWRWIETVKAEEYAEVDEQKGKRIFLREYPIASVNKIILGCRADQDLTERLQEVARLNQIELSRAVPSDSLYSLVVRPAAETQAVRAAEI